MDNMVRYHALNGMVFTKTDVVWYEMQEAFNELSRRAYEAGTEVDYVVVLSADTSALGKIAV